MSKPISISFGIPKSASKSTSNNSPAPPKRIDPASKKPKSAFSAVDLDDNSDGDEKAVPAHESVIGFAADGGLLLKEPVHKEEERVIENKGNANWRTRGRVAPERQDRKQHGVRNGGADAVAEKEEASKRAGLQYAAERVPDDPTPRPDSLDDKIHSSEAETKAKERQEQEPQTQDQAALSALLHGHDDLHPSKSSTTTIDQQLYQQVPKSTGDETLDFRADVASRPDPSSLDDYAVMPVEEFGMALLRGMGKKRRANGEIIVIKNPNESDQEDSTKRKKNGSNNGPGGSSKTARDPNMGFLGIGAKGVKLGDSTAAKAGQSALLGAWGKSDMRRGKQGGGEGTGVMYTPVTLRDRRTGELITERELEERKKQQLVAATKAVAAAKRAGNRHDDDDGRGKRDKNGTRYDSDERKDRDRRHHRDKKSDPSSSRTTKQQVMAIEDAQTDDHDHHHHHRRPQHHLRNHHNDTDHSPSRPQSHSSAKTRRTSRSQRHRDRDEGDRGRFDDDDDDEGDDSKTGDRRYTGGEHRHRPPGDAHRSDHRDRDRDRERPRRGNRQVSSRRY